MPLRLSNNDCSSYVCIRFVRSNEGIVFSKKERDDAQSNEVIVALRLNFFRVPDFLWLQRKNTQYYEHPHTCPPTVKRMIKKKKKYCNNNTIVSLCSSLHGYFDFKASLQHSNSIWGVSIDIFLCQCDESTVLCANVI